MSISKILNKYKGGALSSGQVKQMLRQMHDEKGQYSLSQGQQGLWVLQKTYQDSFAYNVPVCFSIDGLDIERFTRACEILLQQQPLLRVEIKSDALSTHGMGIPYQQVKDDCTVEIIHEQFLANGQDKQALHEFLRSKIKQPIALDKGVMRAHLIEVSKTQTVVLLVVHHIVFDGASVAVLMRTLLDAYEHLSQGKTPALMPPKVSFFDFVKQEQQMMDSAQGAARLDYWREQLAGPLPTLVLPSDKPRNEDYNRFAGDVLSSVVSADLSEQVINLSADKRCYASTVMLAAFNALIFKYAGEKDVIVGMPANQREGDEFAQVLGYFINMVPIRTQLTDDSNLLDVIGNLQRTMINSMLNSYPLSPMVKALGVSGASEGAPIFQVAFVYQDFYEDVANEDFAVEFIDLHQEGEFELVMEVVQAAKAGDEFVINWKYNPELFNQTTIERLSDCFNHLLSQLVAAPQKALSEYTLLDDKQQMRLNEFNATTANYPDDKCIHQLFAERVADNPDGIAVEFAQQQLSYAQLDQRSDIVALALIAQGIVADDLVAVCMARSIELVVSLLGILKAGGAYVPLDPTNPQERLAYIVADCQAKVLVTDSTELHQVFTTNNVGHGDAVRLLNPKTLDFDQACGTQTDKLKHISHNAKQAMYVIYTSGSTGKPKGVLMEHQALSNRLVWMQKQYEVDASDVILQKTPYTFDVSVWEFFLPLISGAKLVMLPPELHKDPYEVRDAIIAKQVTTLHFVPSMLQVFLEIADIEQCSSLKRVFCSGEALTINQNNKFFTRLNCQLHNLYGPTEAAIDVSYFACQPQTHGFIPIGRAIDNTQLHIVDSHFNALPIGVVGELCIAGVGLARGYLNRDDLTAEKFIDNPFNAGSKMYRTGDLARFGDDGNIEYLGRMDFQVKVRGFRIELGEIETQLNSHPLVNESAVVVREQAGIKQLVAYYIGAEQGQQSTDDAMVLKNHLAAHLPEYMVPDFCVELERFPLTSNGKLDRKDLIARKVAIDGKQSVLQADSALQTKSTAHTSANVADIEDKILDIWQSLLNVEALGLDDGFFAAGGNSLLAVIVAERISAEFSVPFRASNLFRYASIRQQTDFIAAAVDKSTGDNGAQAQPSIEKTSDKLAPTELTSKELAPKELAPKEQADNSQYPAYYRDSIAIIGVSCDLPGAPDYRQFWRNLSEGYESARFYSPDELRERGVDEALINNPKFVPMQQQMTGKEWFDPSFFNLSPKNAALMDPQFRLLLQHSWQAIEDAGYIAKQIPHCGVFMSASNNYYQTLLRDSNTVSASDEYVAWIMAQGGTIPTMVSYELGLQGPSVFMHTNCSSSLVALSSACSSIKQGDADYALVGAASVTPMMGIGYVYQPGLNFSSDGRCKTFDAKADGLIPGEGAATILVKRAIAAIEDGDNIYALVRGIAVNNDGADKAGFYAPSVTGQANVIDKVLRSTGVDPRTVGYVEAHGTGTKLGDPIEVSALTEAYQHYTHDKQFCALGSVKPNIGHLDSAAGLTGCIKVALSLYKQTIAPSLHYHNPNPEIDFANSPFYVAKERIDWPHSAEPTKAEPNRAALSSFGVGGTNAHAILEAYQAPNIQPPKSLSSYLVPLSAKKPQRLVEAVSNLLAFLQTEKDIELAFLSYTLQVGREAMNCRVAFVCQNIDELLEQLKAYLAHNANGQEKPQKQRNQPKGCYQGQVSKTRQTGNIGIDERDEDLQEAILKWLNKGKSVQLAKYWVGGGIVDWQQQYVGQKMQRVSLPTYPFAKEHFWLDADAINKTTHQTAIVESQSQSTGATTVNAIERARFIHPLLHENISTGFEIQFSSCFDGNEFFLADHQLAGFKVLPGTALIEMARMAVIKTLDLVYSQAINISDVVWLRPLVQQGNQALTVFIRVNPLSETQAQYEIYSRDEQGQPLTHAQGRANVLFENDVQADKQKINLSEVKQQCNEQHYDSDTMYQRFVQSSINYGPGHRGIVQLQVGMDVGQRPQALAHIALPLDLVTGDYGLHPGLLDCALQTTMGLALAELTADTKSSRPFALGSLKYYRPLPATLYAWIRFSEGCQLDDVIQKYDIRIVDENGIACADLLGFSERVLDADNTSEFAPKLEAASDANESTTLLFAPTWHEQNRQDNQQTVEQQQVWLLGDFSANDTQQLQSLLAANTAIGSASAKTVSVAQIDIPKAKLQQSVNLVATALFDKLKTLMTNMPKTTVRIQLVIHHNAHQALASMSTLLQTAAKEHNRLYAQTIEWLAESTLADLAKQLSADVVDFAATHIRYTEQQRLVKSVTEVNDFDAQAVYDPHWHSDGVYLITGGMGGVGLIVAKAIASDSPQAKVILTGRSELSEQKQLVLAQLKAAGLDVQYKIVDVCDLHAVKRLVNYITQKHGKLTGIIHSAGVINDGFMVKKSADEFSQVIAPKISGLLNLDEASAECQLDWLVCFSSASSVFGNPGQADYALANAFMDHYAQCRNDMVGRGECYGRTVAINWPHWADGGMHVDIAIQSQFERMGFSSMQTAQGLNVLARIIAMSQSQVLVLCGKRQPLLQLLSQVDKPTSEPKTIAKTKTTPVTSTAKIQPQGLSERVEAVLLQQVSDLLHIPVDELDLETELNEYGFDSISLTTLANDLSSAFAISLSPTVFFEYATLEDLTNHLIGDHSDALAECFADATDSSQMAGKTQSQQSISPVDIQSGVNQILLKHVSTLLSIPAEEIDFDSELNEFGFDSISLTTLANVLSDELGVGLSPTVFFEYSTLEELADYLIGENGEHLAEHLAGQTNVSAPQPEAKLVKPVVMPSVNTSSAANATRSLRVGLSQNKGQNKDQNKGQSEVNSEVKSESQNHNITENSDNAIAVNQTQPMQNSKQVNSQGNSQMPVAIIGMSGEFPQAGDVHQYWQNLQQGKDCIVEVPSDRWDWREYYGDPNIEDNKTKVKWGGFIDGVGLFDAKFFGISPIEAVTMDPHQRLTLKHCWWALEDAGYAPSSLAGSDTAVVVGTTSTGYADIVLDAGMPLEGYTPTGLCTSVGPARVSFLLNFHGPSEPIDTACSSALVAIHRCVDLLQQHRVGLALAGGVSTIMTPALHICYSKAGMLSEDGRCKSFSDGADGYGRGEGIGIVALKRLADAENDGDNIYGLILSSAENHGGRATSLTAPNSRAQADLLKQAYRRADIDPRTVTYLEAHGTGTKLGDPVEMDGILSAFKTLKQEFAQSSVNEAATALHCGIGTVKSNIGHLEHAAGVAGLIKILYQFKHKQLVSSLHCEPLNPYIKFDDTPFYVVNQPTAWQILKDDNGNDIPRRAGVSSFGFGGVNAHVVMEEYTKVSQANHANTGPFALVLSARSQAQLSQQAKQLLDYLPAQNLSVNQLNRWCYTLQVGRDMMQERAGIVVANAAELKQALQALATSVAPSGWYCGSATKNKTQVSDYSQLEPLLNLWVQGAQVDWSTLYQDGKPQRINLPTYPFELKRFWPKKRELKQALSSASPAIEKPLLDKLKTKVEISTKADSKTKANNTSNHTYMSQWQLVGEQPNLSLHDNVHQDAKTVLLAHTHQNASADNSSEAGFASTIANHYRHTHHQNVRLVSINLAKTADIEASLQGVDNIDVVYFLAFDNDANKQNAEQNHSIGMIERQFLALMRYVAGGLASSGISKFIDLYVLTLDNNPLAGCKGNRNINGLNGLAYSVAQHQGHLRVRNIDLCQVDLAREDQHQTLLTQIHQIKPDSRGMQVKLDASGLYHQSFMGFDWASQACQTTLLKHQGVYLILGGSGDVGMIMTQQLIAQYDAQVVWIASSPSSSDKVQQKLASFENANGAASVPLYYQVDATDAQALSAVVNQIQQRLGKIDGAIFALSVSDTDGAVVDMPFDAFEHSFKIKVIGGINFFHAVENLPLDFLCYFSSVQSYSFMSASQTAGYSAAITGLDSFTKSVAPSGQFPVGIINWGFWGASFNKATFEQNVGRYFGLIEGEDGFNVFAHFTGLMSLGKVNQIIYLNSSDLIEDMLDLNPHECLTINSQQTDIADKLVTYVHSRDWSDKLKDVLPSVSWLEFERWVAGMLYVELDAMGVFKQPDVWLDSEQLRKQAGILDKYSRWWHELCLDLLEVTGYIAQDKSQQQGKGKIKALALNDFADVNALAGHLRIQTDGYLADEKLTEIIGMAAKCVVHLKDILTGTTLATDIFFPTSSLEQVEKVYKNGTISRFFNEVVAEIIEHHVQNHISHSDKKLRFVEIGSGTGATSEIVLSRLNAYSDHIDEYLYTDISKAFLILGREQYKQTSPYLNFSLFNAERSAASQNIDNDRYDILLATNVLHATKNMRETMRNIKAVLKRGSVVVFNELVERSGLQSLTFGLLDGWWVYEDEELRIPGSPILSEVMWRKLLSEEGFSFVSFANKVSGLIGQQVIVAISDGIVRKPVTQNALPANQLAKDTPVASSVPHKPAGQELVEQTTINQPQNQPQNQSKPQSGKTQRKHVSEQIVNALSDASEVAIAEISNGVPFSEYGIDSILGMKFIRLIKKFLDVTLDSTAIYDYPSVTQLANFVIENYGDKIAVAEPASPQEQEPASASPQEPEPAKLSKQAAKQHVSGIIVDALSEASEEPKDQIKNSVAFSEYGIDSILGMKFIRLLKRGLQVDIETTLIYDYPSVNQLTGYVLDNFADTLVLPEPPKQESPKQEPPKQQPPKQQPPQQAQQSQPIAVNTAAPIKPQVAATEANDDIAVIGLSVQAPKANNADEFWQNLINEVDCVDQLPHEYLDNAYFSTEKQLGKSYCNRGGILSQRYYFEPGFFNILEKDAVLLNPHQRLILIESYKALEDAGYNPKALANTDVGIFVGAEPIGSYSLSFAGSSEAIVASRLSYFLDLKGPAFIVNTGCSSSAVAIHLGCENLRRKECDMVLSGGVFAALTQDVMLSLSAAQMLSVGGQCKPFDSGCDGTIISEGVGMLTLKRLDDATRDNDSIYGVIKGSGINQDGASNGITAPNGQAQERLIKQVYDKYGIDAGNISYVEAHGTGTPLGDSIEANALSRAFAHYNSKQDYCLLGCTKGNIGHTMAASGVLGVIKLLMSIKHRQLPATINFNQLHQSINLDGSAFKMITQSQPWQALAPQALLTGAINSFGHSGTNVHLVVQEYAASTAPTPTADTRVSPVLVPLSARTTESLQHYVRALLEKLNNTPDASVTDIAYTLQLGRDAMAQRVVFLVNSVGQLQQALAQFMVGMVNNQNTWHGEAQYSVEDEIEYAEGVLPAKGSVPANVAAAWIEGQIIDWQAIYWQGSNANAAKPKRVHLPSYPFAQQYYPWQDIKDVFADTKAQSAVNTLDESSNIVAPSPSPSAPVPQTPAVQTPAVQAASLPAAKVPITPLFKARQYVKALLAKPLKMPAKDVQEDMAIFDLGISSSDIIGLTKRINRTVAPNLMADVLFKCNTVKALAKYLVEHYLAAIEALDIDDYGPPDTAKEPMPQKASQPQEQVKTQAKAQQQQTKQQQSQPMNSPTGAAHQNIDLLLEDLESIKQGDAAIDDIIEKIDMGVY